MFYIFVWQVINTYLYSHYDSYTHSLDFNKQELQSLVRVVALICKDKRENTVIEGLKCLRVSNILLFSFRFHIIILSYYHHLFLTLKQ